MSMSDASEELVLSPRALPALLEQSIGQKVTIFDQGVSLVGVVLEVENDLVCLEQADGLVWYALYDVRGVKVHANKAETFGAPGVREQIGLPKEVETMGQPPADHEYLPKTPGSFVCMRCARPPWEH